MLNFIKNFGKLFGFFSAGFTGLLPDPRTPEQKQQDFAHEERIQATVPADPFGNTRITTSPYPLENQQGTSSCVPHGIGLALAILRKKITGTYIRLSWIFAYRLRINYPQAGCWPPDIFGVYSKRGAPLYTTLPTPYNEDEANAEVLTAQMDNEAQLFEGLEYYTIQQNFNDIATLAALAEQGYGVAMLFYSTIAEWSQSVPQILTPNLPQTDAPVRHCVCILPNSGHTIDGVRYVTIQDSAWFGNIQIRHVSEAFIKARVFAAGYWDKVVIVGGGPVPKYTFTKTLKYGSSGPEVKAMQLLLIAEGCLPADCATGNFLGRTLAGVHAFQNKYAADILLPLKLDAPTDAWGSMCIAKANTLSAGV